MSLHFAVSAKEATAVREYLKQLITGSYVGIDGSYEEGVIDTIEWILGESDYIANTRSQKEWAGKEPSATVKNQTTQPEM